MDHVLTGGEIRQNASLDTGQAIYHIYCLITFGHVSFTSKSIMLCGRLLLRKS